MDKTKMQTVTGLFRNTAALVRNAMLERQAWLRKLLDPRRDIWAECGHPQDITLDDYKRAFTRGDVAARVVKIWPQESWSDRPTIYESEEPDETEFEKQWKELEQEHALFPLMERADILSGIGRFGIILLGLDDGQPLDKPLPLSGDSTASPTKPTRKLIYARPLDESCVSVASYVQQTTDPRFGFPEFYNVLFSDKDTGISLPNSPKVHWSRVIHLADNRVSSEVFGEPRMKLVFNRLLDLSKIAGGSGEMYWRGGFPGISLETSPEALTGGIGGVEFDVEATKEQLEAYMNGLQRYIATVGMQAKSLSVQIADPVPHIEAQIKLIAIAMSIPWRILAGSEAAQLASEQDMRAWNRRVGQRRTGYVTPFVLLPLVRRLIDAGVLTKPQQVMVDWPDLNTPSDKDKAVVAEGRTNSVLKYISAGADQLLPPYYFLTLVLGMSDYEARSVLKSAGLEEGARLVPAPPSARRLPVGQGDVKAPVPDGASN